MISKELGRLERVDLRDIWRSEASDFTPWLARDENLSVLADTLAIELEIEAQEKSVGPFRADLLCKDIGTDTWVLVENQLEKTDHLHLGQLLTYASGLQAVTIVWIAARFTEEHRSTLDWLNKITDNSFRFFGLEVELWRIDTSPAAPKFNIVSKPNDWSRSVARAARAIDESELSDLRQMYLSYWEELHAQLISLAGPVSGQRKPQATNWMNYSIGRSNMNLAVTIMRRENAVRAELYLGGAFAKDHFAALHAQKDKIENEFGQALNWEELPEKQDSRIAVYLNGANPEDRADWTRQARWLAEKLNALYDVFSSRVRSLDTPNQHGTPDKD